MFSEHVCYLERIYELYEYLQFFDALQQEVSSIKKSFWGELKTRIEVHINDILLSVQPLMQ